MAKNAEQEEPETAADRLYRKFIAALEEEGLFITDESKDVISNMLDCLVEMHEESQPLTEEDDDESENAGSATDGEAQEEG